LFVSIRKLVIETRQNVKRQGDHRVIECYYCFFKCYYSWSFFLLFVLIIFCQMMHSIMMTWCNMRCNRTLMPEKWV